MARAYEIEKASSYSELANAMDRMRMKDYNILHDSDRILKKFIVITLGQKYVKYNFIINSYRLKES